MRDKSWAWNPPKEGHLPATSRIGQSHFKGNTVDRQRSTTWISEYVTCSYWGLDSLWVRNGNIRRYFLYSAFTIIVTHPLVVIYCYLLLLGEDPGLQLGKVMVLDLSQGNRHFLLASLFSFTLADKDPICSADLYKKVNVYLADR